MSAFVEGPSSTNSCCSRPGDQRPSGSAAASADDHQHDVMPWRAGARAPGRDRPGSSSIAGTPSGLKYRGPPSRMQHRAIEARRPRSVRDRGGRPRRPITRPEHVRAVAGGRRPPASAVSARRSGRSPAGRQPQGRWWRQGEMNRGVAPPARPGAQPRARRCSRRAMPARKPTPPAAALMPLHPSRRSPPAHRAPAAVPSAIARLALDALGESRGAGQLQRQRCAHQQRCIAMRAAIVAAQRWRAARVAAASPLGERGATGGRP